LLAFSTASSESALPKLFEQLDRFGVPRRISGFVLPLGYSFNLDGSMMYATFATIFIAQAYGINLTLGQEILMLLTLMLTSKGMAAVPRASLVVISATLAMFGIPEAGLLLILGVDHFLDMGRTATNVVGNTVASVVIATWEGGLDDPQPADIVLFNTCSVREKAQEKVFSDLGRMRLLKLERPDLVIGVGGCVASQEGANIVSRAPYVDVVFGPQTLHRLPQLIEARRSSGRRTKSLATTGVAPSQTQSTCAGQGEGGSADS
jgi:hypothetical protein